MVVVAFDASFEKVIRKLKDNTLKGKVKKQIMKLMEFPEIGKPMRYARKGTREVYVSPYRLSYSYIENEDKAIFLDLYYKDQQ